MNTAYTVDIHGTEYVFITPFAHDDKRIFKVEMGYKIPLHSNIPKDNKMFFDECKSVLEPYNIIGSLEMIIDYDSKYNIDYREFHSIKYLYFKSN
jgi:hypothetical protein